MEEQIRALARQEAEKIFAEKFESLALTKQPDHITVKDAEKTYNISAPTIYRRIEDGHLSLVKFGGKSYLKRKQLESLFVTVK